MTTALWNRYTAWLAKHAPLSHANLAPPADDAAIARVERATGASLPADVRAVWKINDGQKQTMTATRLVPGTVCLPTLSFLSTELVVTIWQEWEGLRASADVAELSSACRSIVPGLVQPLYTHAAWIPLWSDPTRPDYIGLDFTPGEKGTPGQIINFGRNEDEHYVCAKSFAELLEILVEEVESGKWQPSQMGYGDGSIPWLGDPRKSFFNALYARAEAANPAPLSVGQQLMAAVANARAALVRKDFDAAKAAIEHARTLNPQYAPIEGLLVEVLVAEGRIADAQAAFDALMAWAPRFPGGQALRALLAGSS
jgi:cell wall assembly regulator SMI1